MSDVFMSTALKVHVSPFTKIYLDSYGTFVLELRGPVNMKVVYQFSVNLYILPFHLLL